MYKTGRIKASQSGARFHNPNLSLLQSVLTFFSARHHSLNAHHADTGDLSICSILGVRLCVFCHGVQCTAIFEPRNLAFIESML